MSVVDEIRARGEEIERIARRHGARNVRVFGSVAHGEAGPDSDVDFLGGHRSADQFMVSGRPGR